MRQRTRFTLSDLQPGMRVVFAPEWMGGCVNFNQRMERWLGQAVLVQNVYHDDGDGFFTIEEDTGEYPNQDDGGWYWPIEVVQEILLEPEFDVEDDATYLALIGGR